MSDLPLLTSLENLINIAVGPPEKNILNYKMLQTVLHALAHHMRILETKVQLRISDDDLEQTDIESRKGSSSSPPVRASTKAEKTRVKQERAASKERKKAEQTELKQQRMVEKTGVKEKAEKEELKHETEETEKYFAEKEEKELQKMAPKEKQEYLKEKENVERELEKMSPNEREEYLKDEKRQRREKKMSPKEKVKDKIKEESERPLEKSKGRTASGSSIRVTEVERLTEKVLIVEKGPTTRSEPRTRGGKIDVVTQSEFKVLEDVVTELKEKARPLSKPTLPDSKKLRSDLVKGKASLTDTMKAMQVAARVQAAEQTIDRMAELLTQLAGAGGLPQEFAKKLEEAKAEMKPERQPDHKSGATESKPTNPRGEVVAQSPMATRPPVGSASSSCFTIHSSVAITPDYMDSALRLVKAELMNKIETMTQKSTIAAEIAATTAKAVDQNFDAAMDLNLRINTLYSLTSVYAEQLSSFDTGITTETQNFKVQMLEMKEEMKKGLMQLMSVIKNTETAAVMQLTERYEVLLSDLEEALPAHQHLTVFQRQLGLELQSLKDAVQMLREEKADRDELVQGLSDKINTSQLKGLVTTTIFDNARADLEMKLVACYAKFTKQESGWISALKELSSMQDTKADIMQLLILKHDAQEALQSIHEKLELLAVELGEPKMAILMRLLSKDGYCGLCKKAALMLPVELDFGQPVSLPALHPPPEKELPVLQWLPQAPTDEKEHICKRWAGGSHTLIHGPPREIATHVLPFAPLRRYTNYASDGTPYEMEEKVLPCVECLKKSPAK